MRKLEFVTVALALLVTTVAGAVPTPPTGKGLFFDVLPVTIEGRQMVPLRAIFEWVGGKVEYDAGKITAHEAGSDIPRVELWIGQKDARLSGQPYELAVPPMTIGGRTFVPLRFVAESFGVWVDVEGRVITLKVPQERLEAKMAIAPHPESHLGKIWKVVLAHYDPHPGGEVVGIRVLSDAVDVAAGTGGARLVVKHADGSVTRDQLSFVLERDGWKATTPGAHESEAQPHSSEEPRPGPTVTV